MSQIDDEFFNRADAHIHLANEQCEQIGRGKVSASFMYAVARFNAWVNASGFGSADEMARDRQVTVDYFVEQYRAMLEENLDDYIEHFELYMKPTGRKN